ncbi:pilus assembly protein TadG-related protein [Bacillus sp. 1P06AnD]|uniref:pilus assembly protein TadG-related protein n=1 Tax=Bacillus sp. 1P06AnD TaxID=3132208 RepID=UPI0039A21264
MSRVAQLLKREDGNIALFVLGMLSIMMVLFVFVFNLSKVFAVKEQSSSAAQQASLAATSAFYDSLWDRVKDYSSPAAPEKTIADLVAEREGQLEGGLFSDDSANERHIQAIDDVIADQMQSDLDFYALMNESLPFILEDAMQAAGSNLSKNGGNSVDAQWWIKDGQMYMKSSMDVKGTPYKGFMQFKEQLFQQSGGPKITFLDQLPHYYNTDPRSISSY